MGDLLNGGFHAVDMGWYVAANGVAVNGGDDVDRATAEHGVDICIEGGGFDPA